jgi:hypothetical protein
MGIKKENLWKNNLKFVKDVPVLCADFFLNSNQNFWRKKSSKFRTASCIITSSVYVDEKTVIEFDRTPGCAKCCIHYQLTTQNCCIYFSFPLYMLCAKPL